MVGQVKVRAVTAFLDSRNVRRNIEGELAKSIDLLEKTAEALREHGLEPWTTRISFPANSILLFKSILEKVDTKRFLVSLGFTDFDSSMMNTYLDAVEKGFFLSFNGLRAVEKNLVRDISTLIHNASSRDPLYATRIAVGFHENPLQTPYFPDSTSLNGGVGLSFLYPSFLIDNLENGLEGAFDEFKKIVADATICLERRGFNVYVDYSLSPWMEDSVVELAEKIGYQASCPGFNYGILLLNRGIERILDRHRTGFNEVMLPYAEDNGLKRLGEEGLIKARDLLLYTATCVAGPDMIVTPADEEKLAGFIKDVYVIYTIKRRPLATRIIPVSGKPGDKVDLKRFGEVSVIPY
ncbi:DUF711 family protein [Candidatus Bathyarchaeota archaeon]|nr:DUF711 family protein [Candidatus Bathyarchaeota archaeon]